MPGEAVAMGAVDEVLSLEAIPGAIVSRVEELLTRLQ
jgi:chemotaxis response regulator CheB